MAEAGAIVWIAIETGAIRARFATERLPVRDAEWDEADYLHQRASAYREALAALGTSVEFSTPAANGAHGAHDAHDAHDALARCPVSGDAVFVAAEPADDTLRAQIVQAAQRVFADAAAWRRSLRPAYFARHRAWRARVGSPIQH